MQNIVVFSPCNQRCLHCSNPILLGNALKESSKEEIFSQINNVVSMDSLCITGGGEPTMLPFLPELISTAKERGIKEIGIETNCVRLSDSEYSRILKESGLDYCKVSLHSHIEAVSDKITQTPGSYKSTHNGIKNARSEDISVSSVLHTLSSLNISGFPEFIRFVERCCIKRIGVSFIRPLEGDKASESITPKISDSMGYIRKGFDYCREKKIRLIMDPALGIPPCFMVGYEEFCGELNIFTQKRPDEHKKRSYASQKMKPESCLACSLYGRCSGLHKSYVNLYGATELCPVIKY
jgi:MoaA/NifB/PqqE/SkfB family radical SAM enzyme